MLFGQNEIYQAIKKLPITDSMKMVKIDSLLDKNLSDGNLKDLEIVSGKYANWLYKKKELPSALTNLQLNIDYHTGDSLTLQKQLYKAGQFAYMDYDFSKSVSYFKESIAINGQNEIAGKAFIELGRNYHHLGDYYISIEYFELGETLLGDLGNYNQVARGYLNSINPYRALKTESSLAKLYKNLQSCDSLIEAHDLSINKKYLIQRAIGLYHNSDVERRDTIKALAAFEKSLEVAFKMKDSLKISHIYMDLGNLFDVSNFKKSNAYFEQAGEFCPARYLEARAIIKSNIGCNLAKMGKFDLAIPNLTESLNLIVGKSLDFKTISKKEKQEILETYGTKQNFWIIMSWIAEAHLLRFEHEGGAKSLEQAIFYFKLTDDIFDIYTQSVNEFNSKLQWRKDASQHYGRALKACFYAQDMESAFFFMEKNKAILLTEAIDKQRTNQSFNLPKSVYDSEIKLINSLNELEKQVSFKPNNTLLSKDILTKKERLNSYWDSISQLYPGYVPSRNIILSSKERAQSTLTENELIVEFHLAVDDESGIYTNSTNGYILVLEKEKSHLAEIPHIQELKEDILLFIESLKTPFTTKDSPIAYHQLSHQLYLRLFPTEEIRASLKNKKITLVPDNYLSLLPFEALTTDIEAMTYLLQDSELSYLYSRSFLENNKKTSDTDMDFLGMAPINFNDSSLATLSQSENELEVIQEFYSGDLLLKEAATKSAFLDRLETYKIIHLATHADAQDAKSPWIAFYDGKITLEELYQTQNNASLVVLSGCNTTLGKQETGEGVMSLARGFFYSGAQSVMSTLWSIDDKSTATITKSFYKNLEEGQTKSEALRNAKLNYLENHSLSEASPYHWASFIMMGDNAPIPASTPLWKYLLFGSLGLLVLFLGFRFRRN
jgi:CHAT domain-containing protein